MKLKKNKFYRHKTHIFIKNVDIEKVLIPNKISFVEKNYKYFIGYLYNDDKVKPLHIIMLPKTSAQKVMMEKLNRFTFLITGDNSLKKYNTICDKVSTDIEKNLIANLSIQVKIFSSKSDEE